MATDHGKAGPLSGVKVIDLTSVLMGPYTTQILADMGADVIKVEAPAGDTTRHLPPAISESRGSMFMNVNRGKKSIAADLKQPEGRALILKLVADADIFIHSMRAQAVKRLGLDYEAIAAENPDIIYANLYGFGRDGPYADYPAYDDIVQAASGIVALQANLSDGEPTYLATVVADKVAGLTAAYAIIAALFARQNGAGGQEIEVPMFETLVSFSMLEHLCGAMYDPPIGPTGYPRALSPQRRPYQTKDSFIGVMIYNDKHWSNFFSAIGNPEWSKKPIFANISERTNNITEVLGHVSREMKQRTTAQWMELLTAAECPAMPIASLDDLLADPHLQATGFWQESETEEGKVRLPAFPVKFSKTPAKTGKPGPALGAQTHEIMRAHGYDDGEIEALITRGILRGSPQ